ncbi:peptide ABC transporter substrate-binding protein [Oenococcus alcoholitolerans]|uniref:peptide ABC transporter substrate-binding protein n=1 Tax=Oenococcus alcoholitolerans TaxID=931074 RepID=UPI003F6EF815
MARKRRKMSTGRKVGIGVVAVVVVVGAIAGVSAAINGNRGNSTNVLNEYLPTPMTTQDLSQMTDQYAFQIAGNVQQGLLSRKADGTPSAGLARSWSHSRDGMTWTFHLRPNLRWSNGDRLTASDFVYGWRRTVDPKTASQYAYIYSGIRNADAINSGRNKNLNSLGISAPDRNTVVVHLEHPMPQFENLMAFPVFFAQDQHFVSRLGKRTGTNSARQVYSGPYRFVGWNGSNNRFRLVPNRHYWNASKVRNDGVNFRVVTDTTASLALFNRGRLDQVTLNTPEQIRRYRNARNLHIYNQARTDYIEYNQTGRIRALNNLHIRQALNLATDRAGVSQAISQGLYTVPTGITPAGLARTQTGRDFSKAAASSTDYRYNISRARRLFEQGMREVGIRNLTLTVEASSESATTKPTLDAIQQTWQQLPGLTVHEKFVPFRQRLQDAINHNFDVLLTAWGADYAEPQTFLNMFVTNGPNNDGSWSNREYDQTIQNASVRYALNDRQRISNEIRSEQILFQQAAVNPIDWMNSPVLSNPRVHGVEYFSSGAPYYYWNAHKTR